MRKGFLIYEETRKYFPKYEEAVSHLWLCNCSSLNFLIYEENLIFFFISVGIIAEIVTESGWQLTTSSVSIIPSICRGVLYCTTLAPDTPPCGYLLSGQNSSVCCADQNGVLSPIVKDKADNK